MTTKTATKTTHETGHGPSAEELQIAYQVHTLAQMLYGQLAAPPGQFVAPPPMSVAGQATRQPGWLHEWPGPWGYPIA